MFIFAVVKTSQKCIFDPRKRYFDVLRGNLNTGVAQKPPNI